MYVASYAATEAIDPAEQLAPGQMARMTAVLSAKPAISQIFLNSVNDIIRQITAAITAAEERTSAHCELLILEAILEHGQGFNALSEKIEKITACHLDHATFTTHREAIQQYLRNNGPIPEIFSGPHPVFQRQVSGLPRRSSSPPPDPTSCRKRQRVSKSGPSSPSDEEGEFDDGSESPGEDAT